MSVCGEVPNGSPRGLEFNFESGCRFALGAFDPQGNVAYSIDVEHVRNTKELRTCFLLSRKR